jgi:hypothetical protein
MSGPIVRKYGFPNFEKIFGERDLKHGVEETEAPAETPAGSTPQATEPSSTKEKNKKTS